MPWDEEQQLFAYYAKSDTTNAAATGGGLSILGKGNNSGLRYILPLPLPKTRARSRSTRTSSPSAPTTRTSRTPSSRPARRSSRRSSTCRSRSPGAARAPASRRSPTPRSASTSTSREPSRGGSTEDFQINRGGIDPDSPVTGNYQIITLGLQHTMRLPGSLQTLAAGHFVDLPRARQGLPRRLDLRPALARADRHPAADRDGAVRRGRRRHGARLSRSRALRRQRLRPPDGAALAVVHARLRRSLAGAHPGAGVLGHLGAVDARRSDGAAAARADSPAPASACARRSSTTSTPSSSTRSPLIHTEESTRPRLHFKVAVGF